MNKNNKNALSTLYMAWIATECYLFKESIQIAHESFSTYNLPVEGVIVSAVALTLLGKISIDALRLREHLNKNVADNIPNNVAP